MVKPTAEQAKVEVIFPAIARYVGFELSVSSTGWASTDRSWSHPR
jgi:hypothetical protein